MTKIIKIKCFLLKYFYLLTQSQPTFSFVKRFDVKNNVEILDCIANCAFGFKLKQSIILSNNKLNISDIKVLLTNNL